jgi:hypothetical protein
MMTFLPDHAQMEFQQRMAQRPDAVYRLVRKHCAEMVTAKVPDDAEQAASGLTPLRPEGPVYRGGVEFDFVVTCMDRPLRRRGRVLYGASLSDEPDLEGNIVRRATEMQLSYQVLIWDDCAEHYVWVDMPDDLLPFEASLLLDDKISEQVLAQERAAAQ